MKHLLFIIFILIAGKASSQVSPERRALIRAQLQARHDTIKKYQDAQAPLIAAKDAYKYVGRMVIVKDSLYSTTIVNDTTVACQMGKKTNTPRLTLLYIMKKDKQGDGRFFNTFRRYHSVTIWGTISGTKDAPVLILHGLDTNFTFEPKPM